MDSPVLVTGGAGFIGSNFVSQWIDVEGTSVVNLDKLTYAGNRGVWNGFGETRGTSSCKAILRIAKCWRVCFRGFSRGR